MDIPAIKDYCLEELRHEDNRGVWLDIYYTILKRNGKRYSQARADFFRTKFSQFSQLKFDFPKDD